MKFLVEPGLGRVAKNDQYYSRTLLIFVHKRKYGIKKTILKSLSFTLAFFRYCLDFFSWAQFFSV